jgi:hypothetical protein
MRVSFFFFVISGPALFLFFSYIFFLILILCLFTEFLYMESCPVQFYSLPLTLVPELDSSARRAGETFLRD